MIAKLRDTRLMYKSQSLYYIPPVNKCNLKLKTHYHLHCCYLLAKLCPSLFNPMDCIPPGSLYPWGFPGKNTRVDRHFLLQRIFQTQWLNAHLLHLAGRFFTTEPPGKLTIYISTPQMKYLRYKSNKYVWPTWRKCWNSDETNLRTK